MGGPALVRVVDSIRRLLTGDHDQTASERTIAKDKNQPKHMPVAEIRKILDDA